MRRDFFLVSSFRTSVHSTGGNFTFRLHHLLPRMTRPYFTCLSFIRSSALRTSPLMVLAIFVRPVRNSLFSTNGIHVALFSLGLVRSSESIERYGYPSIVLSFTGDRVWQGPTYRHRPIEGLITLYDTHLTRLILLKTAFDCIPKRVNIFS